SARAMSGSRTIRLVMPGATTVLDDCQYTSTSVGVAPAALACPKARGPQTSSDNCSAIAAVAFVICRFDCMFYFLRGFGAERNLLRLNAIFAVAYGQDCAVIAGWQAAGPAHLHAVFLAGQEALLFAVGFGYQLSASIKDCQACHGENVGIAGIQ